MTKTLVIFCTHIINRELLFFLDHGIVNSSDIDFYVCLNGNFNSDTYNARIRESNISNLTFVNRENVGHDFGGWTYVLNLQKDGKKLYEHYDYFIVLNSTCIGPFIPVYCDENWVRLFTNMITDKVKLVGPTINHYLGKPHVQSYFMCTDKVGLQIGINKGIFIQNNYPNKMDYVFNKEIPFSLEIIKAGYNIASLLKGQNNIEFNKLVNTKDLNLPYGTLNNKHYGDVCFEFAYFGMTIHPYEVIFYKSNRNIANGILDKYVKFSEYKKESNLSKCLSN